MEAEKVKTKEDFIIFLREQSENFKKFSNRNKDKKYYQTDSEWQNIEINTFLGSISAWIIDSKKFNDSKKLTWSEIAMLFRAGQQYE